MKTLTLALVLTLTTIGIRAQAPDAAAQTTRLADEFVAALLQRFPEQATFFGMPDAPNNRAFDNSEAGYRAWEERVRGFDERLRAIDARALAGRPESVTYGFLRQAIDTQDTFRVCRGELWGVDHLNGWQVQLPPLLTRQPVGTPQERTAAIERIRQYSRFVDNEIATLRRGLVAGYSAPRVNVDRVIAQVEALAAGDPAASPFAEPAQRAGDPAFARQLTEVVRTEINPAINRYRTFLMEYRDRARTEVGVSALPQGADCYRAQIRDNTTLDLQADDIHNLGLKLMDEIHAQMAVIGQRAFGTSDVPALLKRLRDDPSLRFTSADEIMERSRAALARARAAMPKFFGRLPQSDVVIEPFADFEAPSMPVAMYRQPTLDGQQPGKYMVNLYKPEDTPRADIESVAFHEAIPGHHLQVALAMEQPDAHLITRLLFSTAFVEGWGLYSEQLADEMGLYSGDLDRLGMLSAAAWRAARLVIDTGLHAKGWTREQAVSYMRDNTASGENSVQTEIDRYIIMPGQALAYMIGRQEILAQRAKAQAALGPRFDIRAFHDAVLGRGGVTLPMLRQQIDEWIASYR